MIDALIQGTMHKPPQARTAKTDAQFATATLRTTASGRSFFVRVIAFKQPAVQALLALEEGDAAAVSGELTPGVWTDHHGEPRPSLDLVAHRVLAIYHVRHKRKALDSGLAGATAADTSAAAGGHPSSPPA